MKHYYKRAQELYDSGITSPSQLARIIVKEFDDIESTTDVVRKNITRNITSPAKNNKALLDECDKVGIPIENVGNWWYKGQNFSIHSKTPKDNFDPESFIKAMCEELSKVTPEFPSMNREKCKDPHCLVFDPADIHIGKLCSSFETGESYNSQIAIKRVREGLDGIIQKANGWNIDKIIFIAGNDVLHTDNPKRMTTSGTPQDTDGMWYDNFMDAQRLLIEIIDKLKTIADVEVVYNPSNHDYMSGFMLLQTVRTWFRDCENVTFDVDMAHRKYTTYGKNLIGSTHMDGAKMNDLPLLMAQEASDVWHKCVHRYIYGHHIHHGTKKDIGSVCIETMRSPSGTDSWHHRKGYAHSPKAVEGAIHHPEHGKVAHLTHIF